MIASTHPYYIDRADIDRAERLAAEGRTKESWEVLRAVLLRHPWKPKRVRKRPPQFEQAAKVAKRSARKAAE